MLCVRPEFMRLAGEKDKARNLFRGQVETLVFIGEAYEGEIRVGDRLLTTTITPTADLAEGDEFTSLRPRSLFSALGLGAAC